MNAQIDWSDYQLVLSIGRAGSLSGAARQLGVNHSTVFRRLNAVEEKLAVRLFERQASGYAMTAAGEEMLRSAERIEEETLGLERRLTGRDLRLSGNLRVTTTDTLFLHLLMPLLAGFIRRYPGIQLEAQIASTSLNISRREADIAIRSTPSPPETLVGRHICDVVTAIYGAEAYLDSTKARDLSEYDWLAPDDSLAHLPSARWLARAYPQARVVLRCNTLVGLLEAAKAGLGIAALPCFMGSAHRTLRRLTAPNPEFTVGLWLLTHADLRRTARVRAFMQYMAEHTAEVRPHLELHNSVCSKQG